MIYLTDYVNESNIEKRVIGSKLQSFTDPDVDKSAVHVLLVWHFKVDKKSLSNFPNVKAVVRYGVGFDNVDLDYCKRKGIKVFNNPDYGVDEVSDTALAMIMNLSRCISQYDQDARRLVNEPDLMSPWQENTNQGALRLKNSSLGIVGVGRIGSALALKAQNIIGQIQFYDPYVPPGFEKVLNAHRHENLESLLNCSDIVSIHVPLDSHTEGFIDDSFINSMKMGSILINTARGGLLASHATLFSALMSGRLRSVGLDVLPEEPPLLGEHDEFLASWLDLNSKLSGRIIINPHTAYYSLESYEEMRVKAATMALRALTDNQIQNRII